MKKISLILAALLATILTLSACAVAPAEPAATPEPTAEATEAADGTLEFSLTTLTGETLDQTVITDNKLVMVNYWATWCGPCVGEIPDLVTISEEYADKGFAIIGVLTGDDDVDGAKQFIADNGVTYPIVLTEGPFASYAESIYAIPTTYFFDSNGDMVGSALVSAKSYEEWTSLIDLLLEQVS